MGFYLNKNKMNNVTLTLLLVVVVFATAAECGRQFQFQRRSGQRVYERRSDDKQCTPVEEKALKMGAAQQINRNIEQENINTQILMPMPDLIQPFVKLTSVESCVTGQLSNGGYSFKMKVKGSQGGDEISCIVEGVHAKENGLQIDSSECQGQWKSVRRHKTDEQPTTWKNSYD